MSSWSLALRGALALVVAAGAGLSAASARRAEGGGATERPGVEQRGSDHPGEALRWRQIFERDERGVIDPNGLVNAQRQMNQLRAQQIANYPPGGDPPPIAGISNGGWTSIGPGNIGGRTRALAIHPTSPDIMFAGGIAGGIWRTTNGGASWAPVNDFLTNLAVSSIVIDPTNPDDMLAGTGEGFFNGDAIQGAGVLNSSDGGVSWFRHPTAATPNFLFVNRLAVSSQLNRTLAATSTGIFLSQGPGILWGATSLSVPDMLDVKFIPGTLTAVAAGSRGNAYYSFDAGGNWLSAAFTGMVNGGQQFGRVELGVSASSPGVVYASYNAGGVNGSVPAQIFKSVDFGANYTLLASTPNHLGAQGWYANAVWVDPTNADVVIVGGTDLHRTIDGGVTWTKISSWQDAPASAAADHHVIAHHPGYNGTTNRIVFFGTDSGIYRADDVYAAVAGPGIPFQELNNNYQVTQFYGGDGLNDGRIYGGTQDNGTILYSPGSGAEGWTTIAGGDGGFVAADRTNNILYGEFQNLGVHRSTNGAAAVDIRACGTAAPLGDACSTGGSFGTNYIAPLVIDPNLVDRLLAGGQSLWRSDNPRSTPANTVAWASIKASIGVGNPISAIAVARNNSDVMWVGHTNGNVYRTTNGTAITPVWVQRDTTSPLLPNRAVASIAIDPADPNRVLVSFGGFTTDNLWVTTNGGNTWTDITGTASGQLPSVPIRWVTPHPTQVNWLYVATDVGTFATENGGFTWMVPHDGPANVPVFQLFWVDTTLVAVTHGRGMFTASVTPGPTPPSFVTHPATTLGVPNGQSATLSVTVAGSEPFSFQWYNGQSPNTSNPIAGATSSSYTTPPLFAAQGVVHHYWVRVTNPFGSADSNSGMVIPTVGAAFDTTLQAPMCATVGSVCYSGLLLFARGPITSPPPTSGGPEPNQPNTINDSCADGTAGQYLVHESIETITVYSGSPNAPFAPGTVVVVQVEAVVFDPANDFLDLYSAADATNPSWTFIATRTPEGAGVRTLSAQLTLPAGKLQAIRANFRRGGVASPCTAGSFNDHDDLIFAVGPAAGAELIQNNDFSGGMTNWTTFENPAGSGNFAINTGVMEFTRNAPAPTTINQATIFQATGQPLAINTPLTATFQIGNSGPARKYMKVLIVGDLGFADLGACTFWLEPNTPLTTFSMKTHTTQPASNIALYFYASSVHSTGGTYLLDNVSMQVTPGDSIEQTLCIDPFAPPPPGGPVGPNLVTNGDFATGSLTPWAPQGPVTWQMNATGNVFEFIRTANPNPPSVPPAVVLQATGAAMTENQVLTATFMLGNSSLVRKRVLILVHDLTFGDLVACTWWLRPNQPLSRYVMKLYASAAWANATLAIYPATTGTQQWMRIDDITLQRTPGVATVGSECLEGSLAVGPAPQITSRGSGRR